MTAFYTRPGQVPLTKGATLAFQTGRGYYAKPANAAKTGMAGLYGGLGPVKYVDNLYAPQETLLAQQQAARAAGLQSLVQSILSAINTPHPDAYGAAAQAATSAAQAAASTLQSKNPDAALQAGLSAVGAPQAQHDAVGQQDQTVFGGQGALGMYTGGALPAGVFAQDAAAHADYQHALPALVGLTAAQGLGHLGAIASQENLQLAGDKTHALQQARTDLMNYVAQNQSNRAKQQQIAFEQQLAGQQYGLKAQGQAFNQAATSTRLALDSKKTTLAQQNANRQYNLAVQKYYGLDLPKLKLAQRKAAKAQAAGGLTANALAGIQAKAEKDAENFYYGIAAKTRADGTVATAAVGALTYQQAIRRLLARYPALGPKRVVTLVNTLYQPGEGGRPDGEPAGPDLWTTVTNFGKAVAGAAKKKPGRK